jgi:hypothetical protein
VDVLLTQPVSLQKSTTFQPVNAFAHQFKLAHVVSFGMTHHVNASSIKTLIVYQIFIFGAIKSAIVSAEINQVVSVTLNL